MAVRVVRSLAVLGAFAAALASQACAAETADDAADADRVGETSEAITNGADDGRDPGVVALLIDGQVVCSGFLVTSHVVVTAGHCVGDTPPDTVYFGADPRTNKGVFIKVADAKTHPDYDPDTLDDDVAVVGLAEKAPTTPLAVLTVPFDASFKDMPVRLVGYGATEGGGGALRKHSGTTTIDSYEAQDFRFQPDPSQTCEGDSGGPALATIDGHELVVGITSSGDTACSSYGSDMRMDVFYSFVAGYATAYKAPATPAASTGCSVTRTRASAVSARSGAGSALLIGLGSFLVAYGPRRDRHRGAD